MTSININHITKIEGHATLHLKIEGNTVEQCKLTSVEGSRYFEGIVKGRRYNEAHEMTSRICGICSCAHTVAALTAIENALRVEVSEQTVLLRELLTLGERIRSHATHLYFLALPDYMGYESALSMLPKYKKEIQRALRMMKIGNKMVSTIGGRDLHPVSMTVGGVLHFPTREEVLDLARELEKALPDALATAKLFGAFKQFPLEHGPEYFGMQGTEGFAILGKVLRSQDKTYTPGQYHLFMKEYHDPDSTANFVTKDGKSFMVGALARMNMNYKYLVPEAKRIVKESGVKFPSTNPYYNNFCQALELVQNIKQSVARLKKYIPKPEEPVKPIIRAGHGISVIEVPRGLLWHEYKLDEHGEIVYANIVTPTAQNLRSMNDDIEKLVPGLLAAGKSKEEITLDVEKLIRAYDPCFSCSSHFLEVHWE